MPMDQIGVMSGWVKLGCKGTSATRLVLPNDRTLSALIDSSGSCQEPTSHLWVGCGADQSVGRTVVGDQSPRLVAAEVPSWSRACYRSKIENSDRGCKGGSNARS